MFARERSQNRIEKCRDSTIETVLSKEFSGVTAGNVRAKQPLFHPFSKRFTGLSSCLFVRDKHVVHDGRRVNDDGRDGQSIDCRQVTRALYIYRINKKLKKCSRTIPLRYTQRLIGNRGRKSIKETFRRASKRFLFLRSEDLRLMKRLRG